MAKDKIVKEKKEKIFKCCYCKNEIDPSQLIEFEAGKKTITTKRSHRVCREKVLERKRFFDWFLLFLDVPSITGECVMRIDSLNKQGYSWDCLKHAVRVKEKAIKDNFDKGFLYACGIIRSQCPVSFKEIEREREREDIYKDDMSGLIDISKLKHKKYDTKDYSNILD